MKRLIPTVLFSLAACGANTDGLSTEQSDIPALTFVDSGQGSTLTVPRNCPIWSPGGGDVDTPEEPLPDHVAQLCVVDGAGNSYGIVCGDAPTAQLAVVPGNREIGLFIAVKSSAQFTPDRAILTGESASLEAWAAAVNVHSGHTCCAEDQPNAGLALHLVAVGNQGMLVSFGSFDQMPTQVAFDLKTNALFGPDPTRSGDWMGRFYVNRAP